MKTISVVGHVAFDNIFRVPKLPEANTSIHIKECERFYGGGAANTAAAIARLGGNCELISPVGADFANSEYESHLLKLGVKLNKLIRLNGEETAKAYIFTDEKHNQVTYFFWGASRHFPELKTPKVEMAHLVTASPKFNVRMAQSADFISFDPGQDLAMYSKKDLLSILSKTNILFANRHEIQRICKIIGKSFPDLKEEVETVVITYDAEGSKIYAGDVIEIPSLKVHSIDPTGAGDGYRAGFLVGLTKNYDMEMCGKIGTTVASFIVEQKGCQTKLPDWKQMKERYERVFGEL